MIVSSWHTRAPSFGWVLLALAACGVYEMAEAGMLAAAALTGAQRKEGSRRQIADWFGAWNIRARLRPAAVRVSELLVPDWFLCNRLRPFIRQELRRFDNAEQILATAESLRYAKDHMAGAKALSNSFSMLEYALQRAPREGLYLEFGVWKGASINFIADRTRATVHGFDSFQGLPEDWPGVHTRGAFDLQGRPPAVRENVSLHIGWFDETLPKFRREHPGDIAFLHIDCDLYSSTKTVFSLLGDRIKPGCVIVFDEYFNYPGWQEHEYRAFQEFIEASRLKYRYLCYDDCAWDAAVVIE